MNPESIAVSLEWAKKLKEAGWKQGTSLFCGQDNLAMRHDGNLLADAGGYAFGTERPSRIWMDRPTTEEILRELPTHITGDGITYQFTITRPKTTSWCSLYVFNEKHVYCFCDDTLANASAAMYCYLAENDLLPSLPTP